MYEELQMVQNLCKYFQCSAFVFSQSLGSLKVFSAFKKKLKQIPQEKKCSFILYWHYLGLSCAHVEVRQQEERWGWKCRTTAKLVPLSSFVQPEIYFNHSKIDVVLKEASIWNSFKKSISIWLMFNLLLFNGKKNTAVSLFFQSIFVPKYPNLSYRWRCCFCKHCPWAGSRTVFVQSVSWETPF